MFDINQNTRLLIAFVADNSFSTTGLKLNNFIAAFNTFLQGIEEGGYFDYIETQLTVFDTPKSSVVKRFADKEVDSIKPNRAPFLAEALDLSLQGIYSRKRKLLKLGIDTYKPWLFILTDGHSVDDVSQMAEKLKESDTQGKLLYMPFLLSDSVAAKLEPISKNKRALVLKDFKADAFLNWVFEMAKRRLTTDPLSGIKFEKKDIEEFAKL
jgi:uncharacterized protein YegL